MGRAIWAWAAVLALALPAGSASAATTKLTFDGACNTATITTSGESEDAVLGGKHCEAGFATGLNGKTTDGKFSGMAILFYGDPASYFLMLTKPYVTGGSWFLYKTTNGVNASLASGTYSVGGAAEHHRQGRQSITAHMH